MDSGAIDTTNLDDIRQRVKAQKLVNLLSEAFSVWSDHT